MIRLSFDLLNESNYTQLIIIILMERQNQKKTNASNGIWTSFGKLVVVGTVAAVCGLAAVFNGS